jgi:hypothetical protein
MINSLFYLFVLLLDFLNFTFMLRVRLYVDKTNNIYLLKMSRLKLEGGPKARSPSAAGLPSLSWISENLVKTKD